jgi:hypothetical protein
LAARVLCALYWINPAVWLLHFRLQREMEQSCDDRVVCAGISAADCADHLLKAIQQFDVTRRPSSAVAMARGSSIKSRIHSLLSDSKERRIMSKSKALVVGGVLVSLGLVLGACAARPELAAEKSLLTQVPDKCGTQLQEVRFVDGVLELKGHCASATRVSAFMRNLDGAGLNPKLLSVKTAEAGVNFEIRVEHLKANAASP